MQMGSSHSMKQYALLLNARWAFVFLLEDLYDTLRRIRPGKCPVGY
jgi:hypothetical protein